MLGSYHTFVRSSSSKNLHEILGQSFRAILTVGNIYLAGMLLHATAGGPCWAVSESLSSVASTPDIIPYEKKGTSFHVLFYTTIQATGAADKPMLSVRTRIMNKCSGGIDRIMFKQIGYIV